MVECTELPLTLCSDNIEVVTLTNSVKVSNCTTGKKTLIQRYESRIESQEKTSRTVNLRTISTNKSTHRV